MPIGSPPYYRSSIMAMYSTYFRLSLSMNVFLSILLGSYDVEKFELERRIEAGTTTNAAGDASAMVKRVLIESILRQ